MQIEILSVVKKPSETELVDRTYELRQRLAKYGYSLTDVKTTQLNSVKIRTALNEIAKSEEKPDAVIIANALSTTDSSSFRKYFVDAVATAEKAENEPAPKDYWKKRDAAFRKAKKAKATDEELEALTDEYRLFRKKSNLV